MSKKTQGSQLYFMDPDTCHITKVGCAISVTGISGKRDQLETTCLEDTTARTYTPGMISPGNAKFDINFDPSDNSHVRLHELYRLGTPMNWALGWSDGTEDPSADSDCTFDTPTTRSWLLFNGYIDDVPFDFGLNKLVTSAITLQISGFPVLVPKV